LKAVILCGGQGTRIQEATGGLKPKPMVEIAGRPILWHIMKGYSHFGTNEFVLCLGHLGNSIKDYFLNYEARQSDVTVRLGSKGEIHYHKPPTEADWTVTLADTGPDANTGARLARVHRYVEGGTFFLTYGDGVSNLDLRALLAFHEKHGRIATVTGVVPPGRFGRLAVDGERVTSFEEKPHGEGGGRINGGFFVFEPAIFDYVSTDASCILERDAMNRLVADGQLAMYGHEGFWQCMDTFRDLVLLQQLWDSGRPPWRLWPET
jgi:glucose-1-phosphate cytidylyltransferase